MKTNVSPIGSGISGTLETGKNGISHPEIGNQGISDPGQTQEDQSGLTRGVDPVESDSIAPGGAGAERKKRTRGGLESPDGAAPEESQQLDQSNRDRVKEGGRSAKPRPATKLAYKIAETAQLVGISESSVRRAIKSGDLRAIRRFRHVLIPASEIERFLSVAD